MGLGYVFMMFASQEASAETFGKAAMVWIFLAYLFHTIGELCTSPVALSFITKLAPVKYASIMMGVYFAATGFGNKLAGSIGEASQLEAFSGTMIVSKQEVLPFISKATMEIKNKQKEIVETYDYPINEDKNFSIKTKVYIENGAVVYKEMGSGKDLNSLFKLSTGEDSNTKELLATLTENNVTSVNSYHAKLVFEKDKDKAQMIENKGDGKDYGVSFVLEEQQSEVEYATFMWLTIFTVAFGLLLILFIKKLKNLTHGAEDQERDLKHDETDSFELADN
jgi:hypothetical protein